MSDATAQPSSPTHAPGDVVHAPSRVPYGGPGPTPYRGVVLARDDPRAWADTVAFPVPDPDPVVVRAPVARCLERGVLGDRIPVAWSFGITRWEHPQSLVPGPPPSA